MGKPPADYVKFLASNRKKSLDGKPPLFLPMWGPPLPKLRFVDSPDDGFGDREIDRKRKDIFPLAWLLSGKREEGAFVAVEAKSKAVVLWWPEDGNLYPLADSLDKFLDGIGNAKRASLPQLKAAHKKADSLSDKNKNEEALVILDEVLAAYQFTPTIDMALADDLIEWVGECFRLRGTVHVLGPPYARKTAIADSERDFRTAITWHSLGLSSPGYSFIGLCETLVYEAKDYARGLAEIAKSLKGDIDSSDREYVTFYLNKARAFALLASGKSKEAIAAYKALANEDSDRLDELEENLDTLADLVPKQAATVKAARAAINR